MKSSNSTRTIDLSPNALYILKKRYLKHDGHGRVIESPSDMFRRVAATVAQAERIYDRGADTARWEDAFYGLMSRLEFLPNSPTLLNAGRLSGQLSSCFVLPVSESFRSIDKSLEEAKLVQVSGGGTGFNLSRLRSGAKGDKDGPVSFLAPLSTTTASVKQGGIRQGCNIAILDAHHPDILDFVSAKNGSGELSNFYLSVGVTSEFMEAVKTGKNYRLVDPATGRTVDTHNARDVFEHIVAQTWKTGDPGMLFLERIHASNPVPALGEIEGVSGCGEQMLLPYESCNLGSVNLVRMLKDGKKPEVDYMKLDEVVRLAVRFLNDVIDVNTYPLPQIAAATLRTRKIGLGVMGFADMLVRLGIPYDSEAALALAEKVMGFINKQAHNASAALGKERGVFPSFKGSVYDRPGGPTMRNASCTTIAPTGTISLIAGCSNGIEPLFALVYMRRIMEGKSLLEVNQDFIREAKERGFYSDELVSKLAQGIRLDDMENIPSEMKRLFVTAPEIKADWHVRMQAAFQHNVDNAVSKTVNLPHSATAQDVAAIYMQAYELGLKGITIYRDGSRRRQPLAMRIDPGLVVKYLKEC
ncbi:MAG: adenosylcobalamin-dependent ribonucleoside-diphosphate reductase [Dehalococcoidia bacterium]|nr:MAG: adenosylcobalamin-dependent ribonucleoside-diphosphate reductase [Dehalococcoidia bacterium]